MGEIQKLCEIPAIAELNKVEGFDPTLYVRETVEMDGSTSGYMDVKYRLLWFRARYPTGKIAFVVHALTDAAAVIEARIYTDKTDPPENYIASGLGRRTFDQADPLGKFYLENAATAALGRALGAAGFGSQFCDRDNERDPDPVDAPVPAVPPGTAPAALEAPPTVIAPVAAPASKARKAMPSTAAPAASYNEQTPVNEIVVHMTVEEAKNTPVPFKNGDWAGKNLGWVAQYHPEQLAWLRDQYAGKNNIVRAAAVVLINAATQAA